MVSAANRAEMWRINQEPEVDRAEIEDFISHIERRKLKLVLISTVGVYKNPNGIITPVKQKAYCRTELIGIILFVARILTRLLSAYPLFGDGLKKECYL